MLGKQSVASFFSELGSDRGESFSSFPPPQFFSFFRINVDVWTEARGIGGGF